MTELSQFLEKDALARVAFGLLTSSTIERYHRVAREAAADVATKLSEHPSMSASAVKRARTLWAQVVRSQRREPVEAELAVLLTALARMAVYGVDDLISAIALHDRPPGTWLSALARRVWRERPSTGTIGIDSSRTLLAGNPYGRYPLGVVIADVETVDLESSSPNRPMATPRRFVRRNSASATAGAVVLPAA